ncbi:hypothetical protein [Phenylobacterium sp.]|uniref:hypothetical protein n=1 Tax=Phenylobacterium sp. TaxID=1871053 RepID=UPI003D2952D6
MTPKRFETLAEAFGGDVARWPEADREAAADVMAAEPAWAEIILSRAGELDAALATYSSPQAPAGLTDRIAAAAPLVPTPQPRPRWMGWLLPIGMGAGLAAACAAGVVMGAVLSLSSSDAAGPPGLDPVVATADDDFSFDLDEDIG